MKTSYVCSVCNKQNVKLWRPYMNTAPLICAQCAEKRQSPKEYDDLIWERNADVYVGNPTGKKLPLSKWQVNQSGLVPSYVGPGPVGVAQDMTDQLIVDISDISESYSSGNTTMIPAIPDEEGNYWGYTSSPQEALNLWISLPTRLD